MVTEDEGEEGADDDKTQILRGLIPRDPRDADKLLTRDMADVDVDVDVARVPSIIKLGGIRFFMMGLWWRCSGCLGPGKILGKSL